MSADLSGVALIILARFPRHGEVKTRLAETIGSEAAVELYRLCAEHVFREIADLSREVQRFLFYSDTSDENEMQKWAGPQFQLEAQVGTDLGERMKSVFRFVFNRRARQAVLVGTDPPAQGIALSLLERLRSRKENCLSANVIAAMSNEFGGHAVKNMEKESGKRLTGQEETLHVSGIDRSRGRVET